MLRTLILNVILSVAKNPVLCSKKQWILRYAQNDGVGDCMICGFDVSN
jgi:hypothetical protein